MRQPLPTGIYVIIEVEPGLYAFRNTWSGYDIAPLFPLKERMGLVVAEAVALAIHYPLLRRYHGIALIGELSKKPGIYWPWWVEGGYNPRIEIRRGRLTVSPYSRYTGRVGAASCSRMILEVP